MQTANSDRCIFPAKKKHVIISATGTYGDATSLTTAREQDGLVSHARTHTHVHDIIMNVIRTRFTHTRALNAQQLASYSLVECCVSVCFYCFQRDRNQAKGT